MIEQPSSPRPTVLYAYIALGLLLDHHITDHFADGQGSNASPAAVSIRDGDASPAPA